MSRRQLLIAKTFLDRALQGKRFVPRAHILLSSDTDNLFPDASLSGSSQRSQAAG